MTEDNKDTDFKEDLWDHYSGLPNPLWYQYKKENQEDEETETLNNDNEGIDIEQD